MVDTRSLNQNLAIVSLHEQNKYTPIALLTNNIFRQTAIV